jgi:hypothetical protein
MREDTSLLLSPRQMNEMRLNSLAKSLTEVKEQSLAITVYLFFLFNILLWANPGSSISIPADITNNPKAKAKCILFIHRNNFVQIYTAETKDSRLS